MKIEQEADDRYVVNAEVFGAMTRLGLVLGGGSRWAAETASGDSLGTYRTPRGAAQALVADATDPTWIRMRGLAARIGLPVGYRDDLKIDRRTLREMRCVPMRWLWVLRENGTHLLSLDIEWHRREIRAVLKAFDEEFDKKKPRARLLMVNTGTKAVEEITRKRLDHVLGTFPPTFHVDGNALLAGKTPLAYFEFRKQRLTVIPELDVDPALEVLFDPAGRFYVVQNRLA